MTTKDWADFLQSIIASIVGCTMAGLLFFGCYKQIEEFEKKADKKPPHNPQERDSGGVLFYIFEGHKYLRTSSSGSLLHAESCECKNK